MTNNILSLQNINFSYRSGSGAQSVISDLNLDVKQGEMLAIQGPSGSGKSTLFYLIGCLLQPATGRVVFQGSDVVELEDRDLALFRNRHIGFVFQQFHLLARATVLQNIMLPAHYPAEVSEATAADRERALELATFLGLKDHLHKEPNQLSGGQQQRVAIARALMRDVDLILADEPTGNLDSQNAAQVLDLFAELNRQGKTIIVITHDGEVAKRCQRTIHFRDGRIVGEDVANVSLQKNETAQRMTQPSTRDDSADWSTRRLYESALPLVFANIFRNRAKSLLTMLGVMIGVAAVLAMLSLGRFAKARILEGYEALGVNKLQIYGYRNWRLKATDPTSANPFQYFDADRDLKPLLEIFPDIVAMSPMKGLWGVKVSYGGRVESDEVMLMGVNQNYLGISAASLQAGVNLSPYHVERKSRVCILGSDYPKSMQMSAQELVGKFVMMTIQDNVSAPCYVIGVLKSQTSNKDWFKPGKQVLIPYTTANAYAHRWDPGIGHFAVTVRDSSRVEETGRAIVNFFKARYGNSGEFNVDSDSTLIAQMKRFLNIFTLLLGSIAGLSLVVGGIGIHNMMLVSVADRLKEIGLRKALGATSKSIRVLFLSEAVVLCLLAGVIGVIVGWGTCQLGVYAATKFVKGLTFTWVFDPIALLLSTVSIILVGVISGLKPALKAEELSVIEALRSD